MPTTMSAKGVAAWLNDVDEPTHAQVNTVTKMCRDGTIVHAVKIGRDWRINCTAEWPEMFPDEKESDERAPEVDAKEALACLFEAMARELRGARNDGDENGAASLQR